MTYFRFVKIRIAQFTSIFLFALVAGVFWGTWFSLSRSIASITPSTFLEVGRTMIQNLAWPMRILMPITILSAIASLILLHQTKQRRAFLFAIAGFILLVTALIITLLVNVPIDNQIKQWTITSFPSNWENIRDRWQDYHTIRTFIALVAFCCMVASGLFTEYSESRHYSSGP